VRDFKVLATAFYEAASMPEMGPLQAALGNAGGSHLTMERGTDGLDITFRLKAETEDEVSAPPSRPSRIR
jgi:hypothetical protein